jgi:hypothetical protein
MYENIGSRIDAIDLILVGWEVESPFLSRY